jgi:hypothetical protein
VAREATGCLRAFRGGSGKLPARRVGSRFGDGGSTDGELWQAEFARPLALDAGGNATSVWRGQQRRPN